MTPCCDGLYRCRFCHDEEQEHTLRRDDVTRVECSQCNHRQDVREFCDNCGLKFGKYFCYDCKLYDDEDKQQFHCTGCGICRVGGRANYFHCDRCDMCLPNHLQGKHKCVERVSRSNCPVCQEDIHTSRIPSQIPPCNHLIHKTCFDQMLAAGHYACPLCGTSMMDMKDIWAIYDREISETPMPEEYVDLFATIQCRDCFKSTLSPFHIMGMKCEDCGSYNTVRDKGPLVRKNSIDSQASSSEPNGAASLSDISPIVPIDDLQDPSSASSSSSSSSSVFRPGSPDSDDVPIEDLDPSTATSSVFRLDAPANDAAHDNDAMDEEPMETLSLPHLDPVPMLSDLSFSDRQVIPGDVTLTPPYTPDHMQPLAAPPVYLRGSLTPQPSPPRDSQAQRDIDASRLSQVARRISFGDSEEIGRS